METKRCTYCHKLQRVESRVCSRCGHSFELRRSGGGKSWLGSVSVFSLPAASPHHAGHYSGLHPEDQPYQSNMFVTPQYAAQLAQEEKALEQEPRHIVLPATQHAPVLNTYHDISQALTRRQEEIRHSEAPTFPIMNDDALLSEDLPSYMQEILRTRRKSSRIMSTALIVVVFSVLLATSIVVLVLMGTRPTGPYPHPQLKVTPQLLSVHDSFSLDGDSFTPNHTVTFTIDANTVVTSENDQPLRANIDVQGHFSLHSTVPSTWSVGDHVIYAKDEQSAQRFSAKITVQASAPTPPHLRLSAPQTTFGSSASGVVSSQTITLENSGGGQVVWQERSDQSWLTVSPKSGMFADGENIQITVNRAGVAPGDYTGHVTFSLQDQGDTPAVLNVTMTVVPLPGQLSVSAASLSYSTEQSRIPEYQVITIGNTGEQVLHWQANVSTRDGAQWLTLSLLHGVLSSGGSQSLTVSVASKTLPVGTYAGLIAFTGDADAQVEVSLTVVAPGNLVISPSSLAFTAQQTDQTLSLQNNGGLPLGWTVKSLTNDGRSWLSVTPANGTLAPGGSITVALHADPTHLSPGSYQARLIFSMGDQIKPVFVSFVITATIPTPVPTPNSTPTATELPPKSSAVPFRK